MLSKSAYLFEDTLYYWIDWDYYYGSPSDYYFLSDFFLLLAAFFGLTSANIRLDALLASYKALVNFLAFVLECSA
jgi:hypothetical protein